MADHSGVKVIDDWGPCDFCGKQWVPTVRWIPLAQSLGTKFRACEDCLLHVAALIGQIVDLKRKRDKAAGAGIN